MSQEYGVQSVPPTPEHDKLREAVIEAIKHSGNGMHHADIIAILSQITGNIVAVQREYPSQVMTKMAIMNLVRGRDEMAKHFKE